MTTQTESLFKRSCHDNGSDLSDWEESSMTPEFTEAISEALEAQRTD